jgi:hypothetical protein
MIHAGDRSQSQLRALDAVTFNYEGWREDFKNDENFHIHQQQASFDSILSRMKKKQKLHDGDRFHSQLRALDGVTFNYEGWQEDFKKAEQHLIMKQSTSFHRILYRMKKTQKLHDGDHSHFQLRALDAVAFDYEGWREDFKRNEQCHIQRHYLFDNHLSKMKKYQAVHATNASARLCRVADCADRAKASSTKGTARKRRPAVDLTGESPSFPTQATAKKHTAVDLTSEDPILVSRTTKRSRVDTT